MAEKNTQDITVKPEGIGFDTVITDISPSISIVFPEEKAIDLYLLVFTEFSKWILRGQVCDVDEDDTGICQLSWAEMSDTFRERALKENLGFWLEHYTGQRKLFSPDLPETFESYVDYFLEEQINEYFKNQLESQELFDDLIESNDYFMFVLEIKQWILDRVYVKRGLDAFEETKNLAKIEEAEKQRRFELGKYYYTLVRQFQQKYLPWMMNSERIEKATWRKNKLAEKVSQALLEADESTQVAILEVGLPYNCSNSVAQEIKDLIKQTYSH
jgi:hypothetical protein